MREDFPVGGCVTETIHARAVDFVALEPFVRRGEYLDFDARFFEVRDRRPEPGDLGVFVESGIDGADDKNFHANAVDAFCCISWMQAG